MRNSGFSNADGAVLTEGFGASKYGQAANSTNIPMSESASAPAPISVAKEPIPSAAPVQAPTVTQELVRLRAPGSDAGSTNTASTANTTSKTGVPGTGTNAKLYLGIGIAIIALGTFAYVKFVA